MRDDFDRRYGKVIQYQEGDQHYRINPETGAGHVSGVDGEFDPAFEPTAHSVTLDVIDRPFVTGTCPVTTIPIAPDIFTRTMGMVAITLRKCGSVRGKVLAGWMEEMAASVDADPFAVDYAALAAEEPRSQYQDTADAAGYRTW